MKLKKINFTAIKVIFFKKDADIEKVLVSNKVSFGEKNYKYFIGCLYDDHKVKPLHIMLPETTAYIKIYDGQTKWMYFLVKDNELFENTIVFGIKSALI